jgi:hypothetical protein
MKKILLAVAGMLLLSTGMAFAQDGGVEIGLDYRFRVDSLKGDIHDYMQFTGDPMAPQAISAFDVKNDTIFMNRLGMNLKANPVEDVTMKARLLMYKIAGHQTGSPVLTQLFMDRYQAMDGTSGHVPEDNVVRVDYAYATVSNIFDAPIWFSVGRRPSTGGSPTNYRQNNEKQGTAGIPALLVDMAFDGMTLGYAPDIDALPGSYIKLCYGRGFDSGLQDDFETLRDTDFYGLNTALYDDEKLHVELQYQLGRNIFDAPSDGMVIVTPAGPGLPNMTLNSPVSANLGDIHWLGGVLTTKIANLDLFATGAMSKTDPSGQTTMGGIAGLLNNGGSTEKRAGYAFYVGGRYDIASTGTKVGVEYNHGTKNWIGMVPAGDDLWTSKLGTRGNVYEVYLIQSLNRKAIAKKGEAFIRLGYQMYDFEYTGSNSWIGGSTEIASLSSTNPMTQQFLAPVEEAHDIYLTFDVRF